MIVFSEVKTLEQCFKDAFEHIKSAKNNGSKAVVGLNNFGFRSRVTQYAANFYIKSNYKKTTLIECELRAYHYGVRIGSRVELPIGFGDVSSSRYCELLKRARKISKDCPIESYY